MIKHGGYQLGYAYTTVAPGHGFHILAFDKGRNVCEVVHGHYMRDGVVAKVNQGVREVLERDPATANPVRVRITGTDISGRKFEAIGRCINRFGLLLNPNVWTINSLVEWDFDGTKSFGEDHDNWTPYGYRRFFRSFHGYRNALKLDVAG